MLKVAILDDYQGVSQQFVDIEKFLESMNLRFLVNLLKMKLML